MLFKIVFILDMGRLMEKITKQLPTTNCAAIMCQYANRIGMNVTYENVTAADGNCFYHAVVEHIHRQTHCVNPDMRFNNHRLLRLAVVSYVRNATTNIFCHSFKTLKLCMG